MEDHPHNYVGLQQYVERLISHENALNLERFAAIEKALQKADEAMNIRLEGMNEFRRQLEAQEHRYAQLSQLNSLSEKLDIRLNRLERAESIMSGKTTMVWAVIVVGLAILGAVVTLISQ